MDRRTLDRAVPLVFGLLVVSSAMWFRGALVPVCIVGGILTSLYWSALRQKLPQEVPPRGAAAGPAAPHHDVQDRPTRDDDPPYGSA